MDKFSSSLRRPKDSGAEDPRSARAEGGYLGNDPATAADTHRYFTLQPIFTLKRRAIGYEALFRAGWENEFRGDPDTATRIMIDNWLLYGFEDLTASAFTFLNCTRETLLSGFLTLLPIWAVFEILESVEPDKEVLKACRALKAYGYRFSLDDFESPDRMAGFLDLADFIKIDFRISGSAERARLAKRLKSSGATLIAEKIETEEEFRLASWEGFELFQGYYFRERASFALTKDSLSVANCLQIMETLLQPGFAIGKLADLLDLEPGIGSRLLRRANWLAMPGCAVNSYRDALRIVGKAEFSKLVRLAMMAEVKNPEEPPPNLAPHDPLGKWMESGNSEPAEEPDASDSQPSQGKPPESALGKILTMPANRREIHTLRRKL